MEQRDTSLEAFKELRDSGKLKERCVQIYDALATHGPMTASEIASHIGLPRDSISPRIAELCDVGLVIDVAQRKCRITGRRCVVWEKTFIAGGTRQKKRLFWIVGDMAFTNEQTARERSERLMIPVIDVIERTTHRNRNESRPDRMTEST